PRPATRVAAPGDPAIRAVDHIAAATAAALPAAASEPADGHPVPRIEAFHTRADLRDRPGDLVPGGGGRPVAPSRSGRSDVVPAHPGCRALEPDRARRGRAEGSFPRGQPGSGGETTPRP